MAKRTKKSPRDSHSGSPKDKQLPMGTGAVYFGALSVANVRCFGPEQRLNLSRPDGRWAPWTIILGNNGSGKSTLLQAIASVAVVNPPTEDQNANVQAQDWKPQEGKEVGIGIHPYYSQALIFNGFRSSVVEQAFKGIPQDPSDGMRLEFSLIIDSDLPPEDKRSKASLKINGRWTVQKASDVSKRMTVSAEADVAGIHQFTPVLLCVGYGAWRRLGRSTMTRTERTEFESRIHLFQDTADLLNPEEWFLRMEFAIKKEEESTKSSGYRKIFGQVRAALLELLPGVTDIRTKVVGQRAVDPHVELLTEFGWVPLRGMGYGYQSLVAWVVDFAARMFEAYPLSDAPLDQCAVCLVDEIDLHLHPSWQRKVMTHLSHLFPRTQFIATAHSPLIVQSASEAEANVAVLKQDGNHILILNDPVDVDGWRADQILGSELFGEVPLRSERTQSMIAERVRLLAKRRLTLQERTRLKELNQIVHGLPVGSSPDEMTQTEQLKAAVSLLSEMTSKLK